MKLDNSRSPVIKFLQENHFVKSIIIHQNEKTSYFPDIENRKKLYFDNIITHYKNSDSGSHMLLYTQKELIYLYIKTKSIYICECSNDISVSQVKMEFNNFITDVNKQGKFPKFLSSFFNR